MLTVFNTQPLLPKGKSLCREDPIYTGSTLALIHSRGKGGGAVQGGRKGSGKAKLSAAVIAVSPPG